MKKQKVISILLAVFILLTSTVFAKDYSDYSQRFWDLPKTHWAYEYISELADKGVINGNEDGSFRPDDTVSRAEWSKMLVVASGKKINKTSTAYAVDYNSNDWYFDYINSVIEYMNFYSNGNDYYFLPNQSASREDVTVSLVRLKGYNTNNVDYSYITKFKDFNSISNDLKKYVAVAIEKGLIEGFEDNTFRGQDTLTRAEAATLLCRAFQLGNDNKVSSNNSVFIESSNNNSDDKKINNNESNNISNKSETEYNLNDKKDDKETNKKEEKDEDEEIIEEEKKPYKIETLDKIDRNSIHDYLNCFGPIDSMTMIDDNIYYFGKGGINKINTKTRKITSVFDYENDTFEYEDKEYFLKYIMWMFYDRTNNKLLVYGTGSSVNDITNEEHEDRFIIDILNKKVEIDYCDSRYIGDIVLEIDDDCLWKCTRDQYGYYKLYYSEKTSGNDNVDFTNHIVKQNFNYSPVFNMTEIKDNFYFMTTDGIYKYDYSDFEKIIDTNNNPIGFTDDEFVVLNDKNFSFVNLSGKVTNKINLDDIEIKDKKSIFNSNSIMQKIFVNSNNEIIIYDMSNKCFRIISENK